MVRLPLALLGTLLVLLVATACGGGGGEGAVISISLAPTSTPTPIGPTPTPAPPPELLISTEEVFQGGAVLVSLVGSVSGGSVQFKDRTYDLIQGDQSMFTFVGIDAEEPEGTYPMEVSFTLATGSPGSITRQVTVLTTEWTVDYLEFEGETAELLDPAITEAEEALLADIYSRVSPGKQWSGLWQYPVPGILTARFGEQRSYNGGEPSGHHSGTDLGAETGDPVLATSSGTVVLARALQVRGNMVIIDHGGGLFSGYAHLSELAVVEGQQVTGGETVGYAGSTGLSTGPHLHWEMAVHGVLVDALRFVDGSNGF